MIDFGMIEMSVLYLDSDAVLSSPKYTSELNRFSGQSILTSLVFKFLFSGKLLENITEGIPGKLHWVLEELLSPFY